MRTIFSSDLLPFGMSVFVNASWKSLLLLLLATVAAFAARRSSAAVRHRIWCLSLSALIFLPALSVFVPRWNVALLPAGETPQALNDRGSASTATTPSPGDISKLDRSSQPAPELPDQSGPAGPGWFSLTSPFANLGGPGETQSPMDGLIRMALIALWIVIAFALLGRLAVESATVRRLAGRCRPLCDERWNGLLADLRARLGVSQTVRLLECDEAIVPVTCGVVSPIILLPASSRDWNVERRRFVLLHELAHIKRLDVLFQMVARTVASFYWFNPLVWYALRRLRVERELACDDCVVAAGEGPVDYADQLVEIARSCRSPRYVVGIPMARSCNLEERIVALLDRARSHRLLSRPISGLLALAALLLVVAAAAFQPVARAGVSDAPILVLRGDKPLSGMKVLAQADSGAKPDAGDAAAAADCVRAWKAHSKAATNLRVSWTQSETIRKGRLPRPWSGIPLPPKDAVIPPVDTILNGTFKVVLSGGKIRYEEKTDSFSAYTNTQGIQEDVRVWDGRHYASLFTAGNTLAYPYGEVQERSHSSAVTRERNIIPLSLFFRIFDPDMGQLAVGKLQFEPGTTVIEGRPCRTVKNAAPNGVTTEVSVDPKRGYIPLAYTIGSEGRPGLHLMVTGLRESPGNVWVPTEWHGLVFGNDGDIVSEVEAHVTSFEFPKQVDDAEFALKFPPGTWVDEQEGKRQYVIQANGFQRAVPKGFGSSKYSWLMDPANNN